jgi:RNA polymerase sigma factor (sigma-70 family)
MSHFDPTSLKDQELISLALRNDQRAFTELHNRYRKSVFHLIKRIVHNDEDSEDLTIITFSKAFNHLDKYTPTHAFPTWLFTIASNASIDWLRKKKLPTVGMNDQLQNAIHTDVSKGNWPTVAESPEQGIIRQERHHYIKGLTHLLNPELQTVIELRYFRELSYEEIANELQLPLGTVKVQIHRAKKALKTLMEGLSEEL